MQREKKAQTGNREDEAAGSELSGTWYTAEYRQQAEPFAAGPPAVSDSAGHGEKAAEALPDELSARKKQPAAGGQMCDVRKRILKNNRYYTGL